MIPFSLLDYLPDEELPCPILRGQPVSLKKRRIIQGRIRRRKAIEKRVSDFLLLGEDKETIYPLFHPRDRQRVRNALIKILVD